MKVKTILNFNHKIIKIILFYSPDNILPTSWFLVVFFVFQFKNMVVYIENKYLDESYLLSQDQKFGELRPKLQTFEDGNLLAVPSKIKILLTVLQ